MNTANDRRTAARLAGCRNALVFSSAAAAVMWGGPAARITAAHAQEVARANAHASAGVTIVLPPRLMAGHPATLAVLGNDGKLAPAVTVNLGDGQTLTTDQTGRAAFTAPTSGDYLLAGGSGASAAALIDPATGASEPKTTTLPAIISVRDRFWICTAGLGGEADANSVKMNGEPALVLAASPECIVVLPGAKAQPGPTTISIEAPGTQAKAGATLVALEFDAPHPAPLPGTKSRLSVRVRGSEQKLGIAVENETPDVLRFARGDSQELQTKGGMQNAAELEVQAIRAGDYSFRARLVPAPDTAAAQRYLQAATALAPSELQAELKGLERKVAKHPRDVKSVRAAARRMLTQSAAGDFRTLLNAAREAL